MAKEKFNKQVFKMKTFAFQQLFMNQLLKEKESFNVEISSSTICVNINESLLLVKVAVKKGNNKKNVEVELIKADNLYLKDLFLKIIENIEKSEAKHTISYHKESKLFCFEKSLIMDKKKLLTLLPNNEKLRLVKKQNSTYKVAEKGTNKIIEIIVSKQNKLIMKGDGTNTYFDLVKELLSKDIDKPEPTPLELEKVKEIKEVMPTEIKKEISKVETNDVKLSDLPTYVFDNEKEEKLMKLYLPNSYNKHTSDQFRNMLLQSIDNGKSNRKYIDYTMLVFSPLRALEGHLLLTLSYYLPKKYHVSGFSGMFISNRMEKKYQQYLSESLINYFEKAHRFYRENRHDLFHCSLNRTSDQKVINSLVESKGVIFTCLSLIDEYYNIIPK